MLAEALPTYADGRAGLALSQNDMGRGARTGYVLHAFIAKRTHVETIQQMLSGPE